jgi:hypothetical protein
MLIVLRTWLAVSYPSRASETPADHLETGECTDLPIRQLGLEVIRTLSYLGYFAACQDLQYH